MCALIRKTIPQSVRKLIGMTIFSFALLMPVAAWAQDPAAAPGVAPGAQNEKTQAPRSGGSAAGRTKRSGRPGRLSRKEAEGTKAADRFEADTVIKSQYRYDGEQLEVDPD